MVIKEIELEIPPDFIFENGFQKNMIARRLKLNLEEITAHKIIKRSIDARRKPPVYILRTLVYINEKPNLYLPVSKYKNVSGAKKVIIVGSGPAGMFAALRLLELGLKPVVIEKGKDVRSRRRDIKELMQNHKVNPVSNYCFGEGGAGTFSDGKLYTRSNKRGNISSILNILCEHGAVEDILIDSHPHIGSNKLPKIVQRIRETILNYGGEYHFDSKVTDLVIKNKLSGVIVNNNTEFVGEAVILATGHSARDIYYLLRSKNIDLEAKPFAVGVRIEHPQSLIDSIQYHSNERHRNLPASSYSLACQVDDKGVYSFCMCPGGIIVPASTSPDELVLNGMSVSRRDSKFANSGLVVTVCESDWKEFNQHGIFAGLEFQKSLEHSAYEAGMRSQTAPAQRVSDFIISRTSSSLPPSSYIPGTISYPIHELLPKSISHRLIKSLEIFNKKMKGFITEEAQLLAPETRTSSPLRIPRDKETLMHIKLNGFFPTAEGAGYAGGIVSSALDGQKSAEAAAKFVDKN